MLHRIIRIGALLMCNNQVLGCGLEAVLNRIKDLALDQGGVCTAPFFDKNLDNA